MRASRRVSAQFFSGLAPAHAPLRRAPLAHGTLRAENSHARKYFDKNRNRFGIRCDLRGYETPISAGGAETQIGFQKNVPHAADQADGRRCRRENCRIFHIPQGGRHRHARPHRRLEADAVQGHRLVYDWRHKRPLLRLEGNVPRSRTRRPAQA